MSQLFKFWLHMEILWKFYGNMEILWKFQDLNTNSMEILLRKLWRVARLFGVFFGEEIFFIENAKQGPHPGFGGDEAARTGILKNYG